MRTPVTLSLALIAALALAGEHRYAAKVVRVIDGDTIVAGVVQIDGGTREEHIRFAGINAPERKTAEGKRARARVVELIDGKEIEITTTGARNWRRLVATVFVGGTNVCELLVAENLAARWPALND